MKTKYLLGFSLILFLCVVVFVSAINSFVPIENSNYQVTVEVSEGWNLIQGFHPSLILSGSQVTESKIKVVWMYSPDKNEYFQIYPKMELSRDFLISKGIDGEDEYYDDYANRYAYWVYIDKLEICNDPACEVKGGKLNKLVYKIDPFDGWMENFALKKGWNFVGVNPDMGEKSIKDFKGNCDIKKIFAFVDGNWRELFNKNGEKNDLSVMFMPKDNLGIGLLYKVSSNCNLGTSSSNGGSNPPSLPGNDNSGNSNSCGPNELLNPYSNQCVSYLVQCQPNECTLLEGQHAFIDELEFSLVSASEEQGYDKATINVVGYGNVNLDNTDTQKSEFIFGDYKIIFESADGDKDKIMGASFDISKDI